MLVFMHSWSAKEAPNKRGPKRFGEGKLAHLFIQVAPQPKAVPLRMQIKPNIVPLRPHIEMDFHAGHLRAPPPFRLLRVVVGRGGSGSGWWSVKVKFESGWWWSTPVDACCSIFTWVLGSASSIGPVGWFRCALCSLSSLCCGHAHVPYRRSRRAAT